MNAATRAAVRYCLRQGHKPFAINNGFVGLLDDNVIQLSWLGVDNWMTRGGSELGTNRKLPDIDLGAVAAKFQQYNFHGFIMIGGFEAFSSLQILEQGRKYYPAFNIPMAHLPATISNNVPLTEFSLGSDTSLNALVDACDAIKQSASASRNRVFVVETQGGKCGYIATMGALAVRCSENSSLRLDSLMPFGTSVAHVSCTRPNAASISICSGTTSNSSRGGTRWMQRAGARDGL